ncbi:MAG: methionine synthase [candidate division NC10 bacterium]|nr:methionine synthase [candidate division NC10 bacterium]
MPTRELPLLPTAVVGSHGFPSWFWTALEEIKKGNYGVTDLRETFDDAVNIAILDQERAGVDIISDGEMRRFFFVQNFYKRMQGLEPVEPVRKVGLYAYDSPPRYRPVGRIVVPHGLGIVDEFKYLKAHTTRATKVCCPGPLTLTIHIQLKDASIYKDRLELCQDLAKTVNDELKALIAEGADFIQIDEPSYAIVPGQLKDYIDLYNRCVEGVKAKIALHICFGNLASRPRGKRTYRWMFPELFNARCDQFVFEFANREMSEIELWKEFGIDRELGAGLIDVKSFYIETPEDVAERIRETLKYVPPEKLFINPDCGFFPVPRWLTFEKLKAMVAGTKLVRKELEG